MTPETIMTLGQQALLTAVLVAAPLLLAALAIGLVVSVFQAMTQINEMTLSFIPKLLGVFVAIVVCGPWMLQLMIDYTQRILTNIPLLVG